MTTVIKVQFKVRLGDTQTILNLDNTLLSDEMINRKVSRMSVKEILIHNELIRQAVNVRQKVGNFLSFRSFLGMVGDFKLDESQVSKAHDEETGFTSIDTGSETFLDYREIYSTPQTLKTIISPKLIVSVLPLEGQPMELKHSDEYPIYFFMNVTFPLGYGKISC